MFTTKSFQRFLLLVAIVAISVSGGTSYPGPHPDPIKNDVQDAYYPSENQNGSDGFQVIFLRVLGKSVERDARPVASQGGVQQRSIQASYPGVFQPRVKDCLPNLYGCQPDHDPWCCSGFCYKEQNWVAGYCK